MEHKHECELSDRVPSCEVKIQNECDNMKENGECLLPLKLGICNNLACKLTAQLDYYKEKLEESKGESAKLKQINTEFRTIMMVPATVDRFLKKNEIDFSGIDSLIRQRKQSLDQVDDNTVLYLVEFHQKMSLAYADYLHEKVGKIQIKEEIIEKRKSETKVAKAKIQEDVQKDSNRRFDNTPYGKALKNYTKIGMDERQARELLKAMGIKE